jgi:hypothetical protein
VSRPDEQPRPDRLDELLDEIPPTEHHRGAFAGYAAAATVRRRIVIAMLVTLAIGAVAYVRYTQWLRQRALHPLPEVEATIDPSNPRELTWTKGAARLALGREPPAIEIIHLPDRDLVLADGCDRAQVKVEVRDGRTVALVVVAGTIEERPRPGSPRLLDDGGEVGRPR